MLDFQPFWSILNPIQTNPGPTVTLETPQPGPQTDFTHLSLPENPSLLCSICAKCGKLIGASTTNDNLEIAERTHRCS